MTVHARCMRGALCALILLASAAPGCRELEGFSTGSDELYRGTVVAAEPLRQGIAEGTTLEMTLRVEEQQTENVARLTTSDGLFSDTPLLPIRRLWNDTLSALTFPEGRLWSALYVAVAAPGAPNGLGGTEVLVVLSLMVDDAVEVRVISGADRLYGLFRTRKAPR